MGELGWTLERWKGATFTEFNYGVEGYWRNWERQTAWLMREVVWQMIQGNPNIKNEHKPQSKDLIYKLSSDKEKESKKITEEELEEIRNRLKKL
jgi:hypothetical protein